GDSVLRVIEIETLGFKGHLLAALRVLGEELPQMHFGDLLVVRFERLPGLAGLYACRHVEYSLLVIDRCKSRVARCSAHPRLRQALATRRGDVSHRRSMTNPPRGHFLPGNSD